MYDYYNLASENYKLMPIIKGVGEGEGTCKGKEEKKKKTKQKLFEDYETNLK